MCSSFVASVAWFQGVSGICRLDFRACCLCIVFTLDELIEIWCRGPVDDAYVFVLSTAAIADRSWVNWDVAGSCREKL